LPPSLEEFDTFAGQIRDLLQKDLVQLNILNLYCGALLLLLMLPELLFNLIQVGLWRLWFLGPSRIKQCIL